MKALPPARALLDLLRGRRVVVLSGAGCSTESGIPDYRGPDSAGLTRKPVMYQEFVGSEAARTRYWARSAVGWGRVAQAQPNLAHHALARLEHAGVVQGIITQNVDGLHEAAGSRHIVELHGSLFRVQCLHCGQALPRSEYQAQLQALNGNWVERLAPASRGGELQTAPDGDAEVPAWAIEGFCVPGCATCGGTMKPDVVFFGESVPRERVHEAWRLFERADVLLVVGSSLTVYSGRRFVHRAQQNGLPIAIINLGPTRADEAAAVKVEARAASILPRIAAAMLG